MAKPPEDDSFLSRWSRRKAVARNEDAPAPVVEPPVVEPPAPADPAPPITDEDLAALPKIEDLLPGMDIRAFMRPGVPSALKNAALQKMWLLTPAIRDYRDPAVDYAWDWNTPGGVPGDGAAPSPERAAQMMRDLFAPRPPKADQPVAGAIDVTDPAAPSADTALAEGADHAPVPKMGQPTDAHIQDKESDKTISNQSDTEGAIPRRRHGGALPT